MKDCEGMFALTWLNNDTLYLARDRFGEKPLYYFIENNSGVYFGSEIKFLFTLMGRKLPINQKQIFRYLVNGYKSLYKNGKFFQVLKKLNLVHILNLIKSMKITKFFLLEAFFKSKFRYLV